MHASHSRWAAAVLCCLLTGCGSSTAAVTDYPRDANTVVFRLSRYPGMLPPTGRAGVVPELSVYGDGTVIAAAPGGGLSRGSIPTRAVSSLLGAGAALAAATTAAAS